MKKVSAKLMIAVSLALLIGLYALAMLTGFQIPGSGGDGEIRSRELNGYYLFSTLLERLGYDVKKLGSPADKMADGCLVYLGWKGGQRGRGDKLREWVNRGNTVFLLGIETPADPFLELPLSSGKALEVRLGGEILLDYRARRFFPEPGPYEVFVESKAGPLLLGGNRGNGMVYLLSEAEMLSNRNIREEEIPLLINRLLGPYFDGPLYFYAETVRMEKVANPVMVLFRGRLFFVTLHLLLIGGLFLFQQGKRFRPAVVYQPLARRSLTGHIKAVGGFYYKAGGIELVDELEHRYFAYQLRKLCGDTTWKDNVATAAIIAERYSLDRAEVEALLATPSGIKLEELQERGRRRREILKQIRR